MCVERCWMDNRLGVGGMILGVVVRETVLGG